VKQKGKKVPDDMFVQHALGNQLVKMGAKEAGPFAWKFDGHEAAQKGLQWAQAFINSANEDAPGCSRSNYSNCYM